MFPWADGNPGWGREGAGGGNRVVEGRDGERNGKNEQERSKS